MKWDRRQAGIDTFAKLSGCHNKNDGRPSQTALTHAHYIFFLLSVVFSFSFVWVDRRWNLWTEKQATVFCCWHHHRSRHRRLRLGTMAIFYYFLFPNEDNNRIIRRLKKKKWSWRSMKACQVPSPVDRLSIFGFFLAYSKKMNLSVLAPLQSLCGGFNFLIGQLALSKIEN